MLVGVVDVEVLNTLLKLLMVTVVLVVEVEGEMVIVPSIKQVLQTLAVAVERLVVEVMSMGLLVVPVWLSSDTNINKGKIKNPLSESLVGFLLLTST